MSVQADVDVETSDERHREGTDERISFSTDELRNDVNGIIKEFYEFMGYNDSDSRLISKGIGPRFNYEEWWNYVLEILCLLNKYLDSKCK